MFTYTLQDKIEKILCKGLTLNQVKVVKRLLEIGCTDAKVIADYLKN